MSKISNGKGAQTPKMASTITQQRGKPKDSSFPAVGYQAIQNKANKRRAAQRMMIMIINHKEAAPCDGQKLVARVA